MSDPSFDIPAWPERRYPYTGGVEYEGETVFTLRPSTDRSEQSVRELVESVVERDPYTYGDWLDLPMPLYLVHDGETGDVFRVVVRDGAVELHVLPETDAVGLRRFYDRLDDRCADDWSVDCRVEPA